jgi:tetratricopeptide (TPR) repeat protein
MTGELIPFPRPETVSQEEALLAARSFFLASSEERPRRMEEFQLREPETLLALCQLLDEREDSGPALVADAATEAYRYVEALSEVDSKFLFDEREYYLGELARIAGCCHRFLARRDDSREWLDRSQAWFLLTANSAGDVARVTYQRLALYLEERKVALVLELTGPLISSFSRSGARESALKCKYLRALAFKEAGRLEDALETFQEVCVEARELNSAKVLGSVLVALTQVHAELGQVDHAMTLMREAEPFLRARENRVGLGKLQWSIGLLLRGQGRLGEAIEALRAAQTELLAIDLKADVAALHLVIADLLLDSGQERQAEWEIRAALPVIDELKMVPEGFAAMSLLRESLRRRSIDRQALRNLHGYFDELGS